MWVEVYLIYKNLFDFLMQIFLYWHFKLSLELLGNSKKSETLKERFYKEPVAFLLIIICNCIITNQIKPKQTTSLNIFMAVT